MKIGTRVKFMDELGTSKGPIFRYGVWWILVEWDNGRESIVLENSLEVTNESRKQSKSI